MFFFPMVLKYIPCYWIILLQSRMQQVQFISCVHMHIKSILSQNVYIIINFIENKPIQNNLNSKETESSRVISNLPIEIDFLNYQRAKLVYKLKPPATNKKYSSIDLSYSSLKYQNGNDLLETKCPDGLSFSRQIHFSTLCQFIN